ncbi:AcvB/VirJ family lysyl-phosphatidylglycerol hydrolase [Geminicoccus harenae]|uniref:AcvB/VirJ family lysyl-phosphatidylglycerol hydrolase n=1 Tax=Geminicoccus harenae TaxID=2498453 RepID=UPI00168B7D41|nr:AcvB/VirJ family lysyl-phosphatidylglycerol hydrolase [Geminicoccus harenae]
MTWFPTCFLLATLAAAAGPKPLFATEPIAPTSGSRLGTLHAAAPEGEAGAILFLVSDLDGWNGLMEQAATTLPATGHGVIGIDLATWLDTLAADSADEGVLLAGLPLVGLPAEGPGHSFALILSGDGGWRDLDKSSAGYLVAYGLPTAGLDSLRHFWKARKPAEVAGDLDRIVRHYRRQWGKDRVVMVGYSFGADMLPAVWPLLAPQTRAAVAQVSLLALGVSADFTFHLADRAGWASPGARPIPPDLARMDRSRVQCFFGADETGCRSGEAEGTELTERPGGHHFDGDCAAIAATILPGLGQRSGGTW